MPDFRARITPRGTGNTATSGAGAPSRLENLFGSGDITRPLRDKRGLVFPYTPTIQVTGNAEYEEYTFTHAIYKYNAYSRSYISEIVLTCDFTSQTQEEAEYTLGCMHFFRTVTKSNFGRQGGNLAGTPPPIVNFSYLGEKMFTNVPVIIKSYTYALQPDVDYVAVEVDGKTTYVPTFINITITMDVNYNPRTVRENFDLAKFRNGDLLADRDGNTGFI
jgi:hypothetical protein